MEKPDEKDFSVFHPLRKGKRNLFLILMSIILSQNTSDRNAIRALSRIEEIGLVDPESVLKAGYEKLFDAVSISGLGRAKAESILSLASLLKEDPKFLERVCEKGERGREELLKLRGIGKKTADVFLLVGCGFPSFPVDRHIARVTERIAGKKMRYDEISSFWRSALPEEKLVEYHLKLISLGRSICRPRNPKCEECPLNEYCAWWRERGGGGSKGNIGDDEG